jgi:hypothetical protein
MLLQNIKHGDNGLYKLKEHLWWRDKDFDPHTKNQMVMIAIGAVAMVGL